MLRKAISAVIAATFLATASLADSLLIEGIDPATAGAPDRGVSQSAVARDYGEPTSRSGPVGEPPISIWEYEPFVVYFEYDRVVHTVAKR